MSDPSASLWATTLVWLVQIYAVLGLGLAVFWLVSGLERFDPNARQAGYGLRLLLLPGLAALWPLFLRRHLRGETVPMEDNAHRSAARPATVVPAEPPTGEAS